MKTNYLFPNKCKRIGWILMGISLILLVMALVAPDGLDSYKFFDCKVISLFPEKFLSSRGTENSLWSVTKNNIGDELFAVFFILASIFIGFSKQKIEDEYVAKIRMESLMWATYICYGLLILCIVFIYGFSFLDVMIIHLFALLIIFLVRFHFVLYKSKQLEKENERRRSK
ncbi:MAG: hypothetical protein LBU57_00930 [Dysgonamonadaceae bacterium]|jgi:hypothetical protein|nr:hypothetical protein [Dysgonamonadaceae bacterium]